MLDDLSWHFNAAFGKESGNFRVKFVQRFVRVVGGFRLRLNSNNNDVERFGVCSCPDTFANCDVHCRRVVSFVRGLEQKVSDDDSVCEAVVPSELL